MFGTPISASASSSARQDQAWSGFNFGASGAGDWNVNLAGSGVSHQSATSSGNMWMWAALGLAAFLLLKK